MSVLKENTYFGFSFCHKNLWLKQVFSFGNQYFGSQGSAVILFGNYLFILTARTELCQVPHHANNHWSSFTVFPHCSHLINSYIYIYIITSKEMKSKGFKTSSMQQIVNYKVDPSRIKKFSSEIWVVLKCFRKQSGCKLILKISSEYSWDCFFIIGILYFIIFKIKIQIPFRNLPWEISQIKKYSKFTHMVSRIHMTNLSLTNYYLLRFDVILKEYPELSEKLLKLSPLSNYIFAWSQLFLSYMSAYIL